MKMLMFQIISIIGFAIIYSSQSVNNATIRGRDLLSKLRKDNLDGQEKLSAKSDNTPYLTKRGFGLEHKFGHGSTHGDYYNTAPIGKGHLFNGHGDYYHGKSLKYDYKPYDALYKSGSYGNKNDKYLDHGKLDKDHGHYDRAIVYNGHGKKHYEYDSLKDGHLHKSNAGYSSKFGSPYTGKHYGDHKYGHDDYNDYSYPRSHHYGKHVNKAEHYKDIGDKDYHREKIEDTLVEKKFFSEKVSDSHLHDRHSYREKDKKLHGVGKYGHTKHLYPQHKDLGYYNDKAYNRYGGDWNEKWDDGYGYYPQKDKTLTKALKVTGKPK